MLRDVRKVSLVVSFCNMACQTSLLSAQSNAGNGKFSFIIGVKFENVKFVISFISSVGVLGHFVVNDDISSVAPQVIFLSFCIACCRRDFRLSDARVDNGKLGLLPSSDERVRAFCTLSL